MESVGGLLNAELIPPLDDIPAYTVILKSVVLK